MSPLFEWDWLTNSCRSLSSFFSSSTPSQHFCPHQHLKEPAHKCTSWPNSYQARRTKSQIWENGIICLAAACSVEVAKSRTVKFPLNLHFLWCNSLKWSREKKFQNCRPAADKMPHKLCHLWLGLSQSTCTRGLEDFVKQIDEARAFFTRGNAPGGSSETQLFLCMLTCPGTSPLCIPGVSETEQSKCFSLSRGTNNKQG